MLLLVTAEAARPWRRNCWGPSSRLRDRGSCGERRGWKPQNSPWGGVGEQKTLPAGELGPETPGSLHLGGGRARISVSRLTFPQVGTGAGLGNRPEKQGCPPAAHPHPPLAAVSLSSPQHTSSLQMTGLKAATRLSAFSGSKG